MTEQRAEPKTPVADEPLPGLFSWHDQLRVGAAVIDGAASPLHAIDALVHAGWRPPADALPVPSEERVRVHRLAYERMEPGALARWIGHPGPPWAPDVTVVEPDGSPTEVEGNGP